MRVFRALLYVFPASFRAEYGAEMCRVFAQRRREVAGPATVALWVETFVDAVAAGARSHLDLLRQDLRTSWRGLRRAPGFAVAAVVVSALGIGANTAVFSVTDRVLIRALPFPDAERLVSLWEHPPGYRRMELSPPNYRDWKERSTSFSTMAAFHGISVNLVGSGEPRRLDGQAVTAELFPLLGSRTGLGRTFTAEDVRDDAQETVVLSYGLWQSGFGGDPGVLGRQVRLDDDVATVIGVMPRGFYFPDRDTQLWTPKRFSPQDFEDRGNTYLRAVARLEPDVSIERARAEMTAIAAELERQYPVENAKTAASVLALRDELSEQARLLLLALFGASACVLLIACTNLANLLLARTLARRKELALRTALGAGRERLVRQLLTESLALSAAGGLLGILVATVSQPFLARLVPSSMPLADATVFDPRVLAFAIGLTLLTGLGFGVLPALRIGRRAELGSSMEGLRTALGERRQRLRTVLVIAQVATSVVLLIACGLLLRALWRVQAVDPGFRADHVLTLRTPLPMTRYAPTAKRVELFERVLGEIRALPGVEDAAAISFLPLVMRGGIWPVRVEGFSEDDTPSTASLRQVTTGFFATLGIPIEAGRDVAATDVESEDRPSVAVVSRSFAQRYWPGQDPLGRSFEVAFRDRVVVGVVGDIRVRGLERGSEPQVYIPYRQVPDGALVFYWPKDVVVRAAGDPGALAPAIRGIVHAADPELPVADVRLLADIVAGETAPRRAQIRALAAFAGLALLLAGIGIYGLLAYAVAQRRNEIGLRVALGARRGDVLGLVFREATLLAAAGASIGLGAAYAAGRGLEALLSGIRPADAPTFAAAVVLVVTTTLAGSVLPALRAARVDPTTALRTE